MVTTGVGDDPAPPRKRRRFLRWTAIGLGLVVLLLLAQVRDVAYDKAVVAPWAWPPGPVLTTTWVGSTTTPGGNTAAVLLDLERPPRPSSQSGWGYFTSDTGTAIIGGTGRFCSSDGPPLDLKITGFASRTPDDLSLFLEVAELPTDGLSPGRFEGDWDGAASLVITGDLTVNRGGAAVASADILDSAAPVTFELEPGTRADLDARCPAR